MNENNETPAAFADASGAEQKQQNSERNIASKTPKSNPAPHKRITPPEPILWSNVFKLGFDGVYKAEKQGDNQFKDVWVFSPLVVLAQTYDEYEQNWGLLVMVKSPNDAWHKIVIARSSLGAASSSYRETLMGLGLIIPRYNYTQLHSYLSDALPPKILRLVSRVGWHGNCFVLPDETYGKFEASGKVTGLFKLDDNAKNPYACRGSLEEWQEHIGRYCIGNSRLLFGVSMAFAAVIQKPCDFEGGGVNVFGNSSSGKTTLLRIAGSVCGGGRENGYLHRWRATDNALESIAVDYNDCLLCLDEIAQVEGKAIGEIAYMLANGQGKARSNKDGTAKRIAEWRSLFLSSGELSLEQKLQVDGRRFMAGQAVRIVSIPVDAGIGFGVFENLHGFADSKKFSEYFQATVKKHFGVPLRHFIKAFTENLEDNRQKAKTLIKQFEDSLCPQDADGQVKRVCRLFALVAAAGELATVFGVVPWESGNAFSGCKRCFHDWIAMRGGIDAAEAREAVLRLQAIITAYRTSRFEPWERGGVEVFHNSVGFRREENDVVEFMFYKEPFTREVCQGGNPKAIAQHLAKLGFLEPDPSGKSLMKTHNPPRLGRTMRFYTIKGEILDDED